MPPLSFSVSEVRAAATCPRIVYFDAVNARRNALKSRSMTRIWKAGEHGAEPACGSLFHAAVEAFNRRAGDAPEVRAAIVEETDPRALERRLREFLNRHCVDLDAVARQPPSRQQSLGRTFAIYMGELADIVADARSRGKPAAEIVEQLFGDHRRRVNVAFPVGPNGTGAPVRVVGVLDYVFYDWRTTHNRVIDYKLTPPIDPSNDLFQVALYALMHHAQHQTEPDAAVLYLHPERTMFELTWDQVNGQRHKLFNLLASMAAWVQYDESTGQGLKPPGVPSVCAHCRWDRNDQCQRRLGPKTEGQRLEHGSDTAESMTNDPMTDDQESEKVPRSDISNESGETPRSVIGHPASDISNESGETPRSVIGHRASDISNESGETPRSVIGHPVIGHSDSRPDALRIGQTDDGETVDLPVSALPTHLAIVGAAGSGKTYLAKVVVEEAVRLGIPVLAIDPQGDLVQFLRPSTEGNDRDRDPLRRAYLDRVEPRVWTPGSSHGRRLSLDPIRLAGRDELSRLPEPSRRDEEWEGMLAVAAAQLVSLARMGGETDSQQTFLLQVLRKLAAETGRDAGLAAVAAAAPDPTTVGLDDPDQLIKKSEREKLARKLNGLRFGPSANLFNGGQRLDLDAFCQPESPGKTPLNVVYLNALADDGQKHAFVAALAAEVYRWMITSATAAANRQDGRPALLFYIDEARDYIPAGMSRPPAKEPLVRLFTQGRKFGVAGLICTQSPRSVSHDVFGNCSTKLIGRLESAQDVERVGDWFKNEGTPAWLAGRKGAKAGSFVGRWPEMPAHLEGRSIRCRPLFSLHEGAWTPDRLEIEIKALGNGPGIPSAGPTAND